MGEIASELGPALKVLLIGLFKAWWASLDQESKDHVVIGLKIAALVATIAIAVFILRAILVNILPSLVKQIKAYASKMPLGDELLDTLWQQIHQRLYRPWQVLSADLNPSVLLAPLLLLAAAYGDWPHNFYVMLRFVVSGTFILLAMLLHRRGNFVWKTTLALLGVLFNPLAPFRLQRETWQAWNLIAAVSLVPAAIAYIDARKQAPLRDPTTTAKTAPVIVPVTLKYRYCRECSRRVGKADAHCKRCNAALDSTIST